MTATAAWGATAPDSGINAMTIGTQVLLDLDTIRIVRTNFVQRDQMRNHQAEQHQRDRDHMESKEAIQSGV